MISKAKIKLVSSLKLSKFRKEHQLFVAEGTTNVLDFIAGGMNCQDVFATEQWLEENHARLRKASASAISQKEMKQISNFKNPSDVLGVFKIPETKFPNLETFEDLILVLDDIRDPGNLGTIIRTADWFNIPEIICSENSVDVFNPKVVQASMGSLCRVNVSYQDLKALFQSKPDSLQVYGAVLDGAAITEINKPLKGFILIGNETRGISKGLLSFIDTPITIPNIPLPQGSSAESLNASIATAIICYEFRR